MIKRDFYLNPIIRHMHNGEIKVIAGIRRAGISEADRRLLQEDHHPNGYSHHFYDDDGIFHCNLIDFRLERVDLF